MVLSDGISADNDIRQDSEEDDKRMMETIYERPSCGMMMAVQR